MLISEVLASDTAYADALDAFLARHRVSSVREAYAAVRNMPYFSGADRTPLAALRSGRGACTAKHLVLRDALRHIGAVADVEIVEGDFAAAIPLHPSQPAALQDMIRKAGVTDFHCRVRLTGAEGAQHLDATWPDALVSFGFADNRGWTGLGDTVQAIPGAVVRSRAPDVLAEKARLLAGLGAAATARRLAFLRLLSEWLAAIDGTQGRA